MNGCGSEVVRGWNTFNCYGCSVTEFELIQNATVLTLPLCDDGTSLVQHGWKYVVLDAEWADDGIRSGGCREDAILCMDDNGRLVPSSSRFPSSVEGNGFSSMAQQLHSMGLLFGIHIQRGIPRQAVLKNAPILGTEYHARDIADTTSVCPWNTDMYGINSQAPGAQEYYNSILALYSEWKIDYLKADDMQRPYQWKEVEAIHHAILKSGRKILLSLSPGDSGLLNPESGYVEHLHKHADFWRISHDVWDDWDQVKHHLTLCAAWSSYSGKGHGFADADILPLGRIGPRPPVGDIRDTQLSHDEQRVVMTLWIISKSPLFFGGELLSLKTEPEHSTLRMLSNSTALYIHTHCYNQTRLPPRPQDPPTSVVWCATCQPYTNSTDSRTQVQPALVLALFNLGEHLIGFDVDLQQLAFLTRTTVNHTIPLGAEVIDVWRGNSGTYTGTVINTLNWNVHPHATALLLLRIIS